MIYVILGKGGSGKDTAFKALKEALPDFQPWVLTTTRPPRPGEVHGVDYHFVNDSTFSVLDNLGVLVHKQCYETVYGTWWYGLMSTRQDFGKPQLLVNTLTAFESLKTVYGPENVVGIYLDVPEAVLLERQTSRISDLTCKMSQEIARRIQADSIDFSEGNLEKAGVVRISNNRPLAETIEEIVKLLT